MGIVLPPVEPYFFRLIDRAHQQPDSDGQQFDVRQGNTHITRDHQSLVENPIQDIDQIRGSRDCRHSIHGILSFCQNVAKHPFRAPDAKCISNRVSTRWDDSLKTGCAGNFAELGIQGCWLSLPELLKIFAKVVLGSAQGTREI
jgi:hypothetical protein